MIGTILTRVLWPSLAIGMGAGLAQAQSNTADTAASCNASFHLTCIDQSGDGEVVVSSESSAAPIAMLGDHPLELAALAVALAALLFIKRRAVARRRGVSGCQIDSIRKIGVRTPPTA